MTARTLAANGRLARTAFPEREDKSANAPDQWALGVVASMRRAMAPPAAREVARLTRQLTS